jgi:ribosomal protein L15
MADITETESKFLNSLVQDCITYRLNEKEALEYIKTRFRDISISSYKIRKANVLKDKSTQIWLNHFTRVGFVSNHKKQIEEIQNIQNDSLHQLFEETIKKNKRRDEHKILKLKADIRENSKLLSELSLGTPIISAIKAKLQDKDKRELEQDGPKTFQISK